MKRGIVCFLLCAGFLAQAQQKDIQIVFTSDVHFGLKKAHFRNSPDSSTSEEVNRAMAVSIKAVGKVDYLVVTGDIANREEVPIQSASVSWRQFEKIYKPLHIPLLLVPGNHDVSNDVGYYKIMSPEKDAGALAGIYNTMHPHHHLDTSNFIYSSTKFNYSRNIGGIHFQFITIWPDSANRVWMENDLKKINPKMPVLIFVHDPPEGDPRQFTNPSGRGINAQDKFENLISEVYNNHYQRDLDSFLKKHSNIKGYFHGHSNFQEFYTYKGLDHDLALPCFRVDSPMKGKNSLKDENLFSFQVITIHPSKKQLEVKECFWNRKNIEWGESYTLKF